MKKVLSLVALIGTMVWGAQAQIVTPQPSPGAKLTQTVGLTEVTVEYSRPGARGREVFGNLVPFGQIWRTGANAATNITFSDDVKLGGEEVPAGTYALYTIPTASDWTIIIHKHTTHWGANEYDEAQDLARFVVPSKQSGAFVETFTIDVHSMNDNMAMISLQWANTLVNLPLEVNYKDKVMASIERTLAGPSANDYASAANFYLSTDQDLGTALEWISKATEMRPDAFWWVHIQARIYMAMGEKAKAKAAAEKSKEIAANAPNDFGYVANNNRLLEEIAKM